MIKSLKLVYTDGESPRQVTVGDPKDGLDDSIINQAMDKMLGAGVLCTNQGVISAKKAAYLDSTERKFYKVNKG